MSKKKSEKKEIKADGKIAELKKALAHAELHGLLDKTAELKREIILLEKAAK